ncbi:TetR/AcrR family transcriptional regulator [Streptomyces sp. NPDC090499]|uniref:TetR/AcrR family transcriptional regulator n=1 Tax=unclassified Streptomyces TaxID=2593676 RepID=UPI003804622B
MTTPQRKLPRGTNALPVDEVEALQRGRVYAALAQVLTERGYAAATVEHVIKRAGVSRQTFYRYFDSKADCFAAAYQAAGESLLAQVLQRLGAAGSESPAGADDGPPHRFGRLVDAYIHTLAADWPTARLCLVEAFAAGPGVLPVRAPLYDTVVDLVAETLGVTDPEGLLACRMILAATTALATSAVADGDQGQLDAAAVELNRYVRQLWDAGLLGPRPRPTAPDFPPT